MNWSKAAVVLGLIASGIYLWITLKKCSCALPSFFRPFAHTPGGAVPVVVPHCLCHTPSAHPTMPKPASGPAYIASLPALPAGMKYDPRQSATASYSPLASCESVITNSAGTQIVVSSSTTGNLLNTTAQWINGANHFMATFRDGSVAEVNAQNQIIGPWPPKT